jgi:hypothetical protein
MPGEEGEGSRLGMTAPLSREVSADLADEDAEDPTATAPAPRGLASGD